MQNIWHLIEKIIGVYRWHPKIALRYLPVVKELKSRLVENDVLEIGSGGLGIAPYLKRRVIGLDTHFAPPISDKLIPVKGLAQKIPFADKSFMAAISLDMLEHIPANERLQVISEMLRVAKKLVVIGAPMGQAAHQQDEQLRREYKSRFGYDYQFLQEQVEFGVPDVQTTIKQIKTAAEKWKRKIQIRICENINLNFRLFLMRGWMSKNLLINFIFRKMMLICIPVFLFLNQPPTYRKIIFVKINDKSV